MTFLYLLFFEHNKAVKLQRRFFHVHIRSGNAEALLDRVLAVNFNGMLCTLCFPRSAVVGRGLPHVNRLLDE